MQVILIIIVLALGIYKIVQINKKFEEVEEYFKNRKKVHYNSTAEMLADFANKWD